MNTPKHEALRLFRDDHKKILGLLRQLAASDVRAHEMKSGVARELFTEFEMHALLEEELFFPLLSELADEKLRESIADAVTTHHSILSLIDEMKSLTVDDPHFDEDFEDLSEIVDLLIQDEENEIYAPSEELLGSVLESIAPEVREMRARMAAAPGRMLARAELVQNPRGGEQKRKVRRAI